MNQDQTNIFEFIREKYKIKKKIRIIELFAGYGSQSLALKYSSIPFEHWKICEWAVKSIQAYKDIHFPNDNEDYSMLNNLSYEKLVDILYNYGISQNYNEPMKLEQIKRLGEKQLRKIFNNIVATHNLVNIQKVKGYSLEIEDTDKYEYIMTYSFPCQDLSLAGKGKGMSDTSTRSGMLWEVERILTECKELGTLPQCLLMENVPQVHSSDNVQDFNKWQLRLEELGYKNYWQDLIATDYGIPQTRNRCFMVSILGDYSYTFPKPIPLKLKLKDLLEENVDEKYFLSDKMKEYIFSEDDKYKVNKNSLKLNRDIACSKTTREGNTRADASDYICEELEDDSKDKNCLRRKMCNELIDQEKVKENDIVFINYTTRRYNEEDYFGGNNIAPTMTTRVCDDFAIVEEQSLKIKNATEKGYLEATDGDGIDISSRMQYHRGNVQKDKIQTLDTMGGESKGVVIGTYQYSKSDKFMQGKSRLQLGKEVSDTLQTTQKEGVVIKENSTYTPKEKELFTEDGNIRRYINSDIIDKFEEGQCETTTFPNGYGHGPRTHNESVALNTIDKPSVKQNLRIRKLTPKECFRLMGVKDEDFEKCAKNQSNSSLYHLAGDSIVVNVLQAIFEELI